MRTVDEYSRKKTIFLESAFSYNAMHVDNSQKRIYHADKLEKAGR